MKHFEENLIESNQIMLEIHSYLNVKLFKKMSWSGKI